MRLKYPLESLAIGEDFTVTESDVQRVRLCMHNYGKRTGKYFISKRYKGLGLVMIKRMA